MTTKKAPTITSKQAAAIARRNQSMIKRAMRDENRKDLTSPVRTHQEIVLRFVLNPHDTSCNDTRLKALRAMRADDAYYVINSFQRYLDNALSNCEASEEVTAAYEAVRKELDDCLLDAGIDMFHDYP